jgi:FkbM family methyltransferase
MAEVKSNIRSILKPIFFKILGKLGYFKLQVYAKKKDIKKKLVEEDEMYLLPFLIRSSDTVLDIGANFAYYTERLSKICSHGKVVAFEPIPFTYSVSKRIISDWKLKNVNLHNLGVSDFNGEIEFEVPLQDFGAISAGQAHLTGRDNGLKEMERLYTFSSHQTIKCRVVKLDDFLSDIQNLTFIKIDIEGAELSALKGMRQLLEKFRPVILIEIVPAFLKAFNIEVGELLLFFNDINYTFNLFNSETKKLYHSDNKLIERNYIMIPEEKFTALNFLF